MKTIKSILFCAALSLAGATSCVKDYVPRAVVVPTIAPRVEKVVVQAKSATSQAEKTYVLAQAAKKEHTQSPIVAQVEESARLTVVESKKTEFELNFLSEYAKNVDIQAAELQKESYKKDEAILTQQNKTRAAETQILKQKNTISNLRTIAISLGSLLFVCICFITKPWLYFI
jgi:hypothetical protein